jgi:hypothetical protein
MNWEQLYTDFRQKYEGCYCQVLLEGYRTSKVFYLEHVEKTLAAPLLHLRNEEFGEVILKYDDSKSDVSFQLPEIGLYNYKNNVIMIRRQYLRQFRRGICNATIWISPIYSILYNGFSSSGEGKLNEGLTAAIVTPTPTISLKEAINALDKVLAICLSSEFALGLSTKLAGQDFILWYYENPVGTVDPVSRRVFLREGQFKQEYFDFTSKIQGEDDFTFHI